MWRMKTVKELRREAMEWSQQSLLTQSPHWSESPRRVVLNATRMEVGEFARLANSSDSRRGNWPRGHE